MITFIVILIFRWGRCYRVHGQFQGSSLFLPVDLVSLSHAYYGYAIWSLRLLKFILSRLSVLIFILYCCIVYVLIVEVSNQSDGSDSIVRMMINNSALNYQVTNLNTVTRSLDGSDGKIKTLTLNLTLTLAQTLTLTLTLTITLTITRNCTGTYYLIWPCHVL